MKINFDYDENVELVSHSFGISEERAISLDLNLFMMLKEATNKQQSMGFKKISPSIFIENIFKLDLEEKESMYMSFRLGIILEKFEAFKNNREKDNNI